MVIEHYRNGDAGPVYQRFRERGRMMPASVSYVSSWVTEDMAHCYQVMDAPVRADLDAWISRWSDIVDFEVVPVITSAEAQARRVPEP